MCVCVYEICLSFTSKFNSQVQPAISMARLDASIADMKSSLEDDTLEGDESSGGVSTESRILPLVNMGKGLLNVFV